LVNNAGISPKCPDGSRLNSLETDIGTWQSMYNTNFYSPLLLTRGFVAELSPQATYIPGAEIPINGGQHA
jgi:NAD(P)-dependent dehydrogenase (short-subunit alcohol dehydrogenase family)